MKSSRGKSVIWPKLWLGEKEAKEAKLNNKQLLAENKGFFVFSLAKRGSPPLRLAPQRFYPPIKSGIVQLITVQLITAPNHSLLQKVS